MRSYKYFIGFILISVVSLAFYVGYVLNLEKPELVVETKNGSPKQSTLQNLQINLNDVVRQPTDFSVSIKDGQVSESKSSYLNNMYLDRVYINDEAPRSFKQFMQEETYTLMQDSVTYGLKGQKDGNWDLQYWDLKTKKLTTKQLSTPSEVDNKKYAYSPFQRTEDLLYVERYSMDEQTQRSFIYVIDLKNNSVRKQQLPIELKKNEYIESFYKGQLLYSQTYFPKNNPDTEQQRLLMTDGKKTKRLKQLEGEDFNTRILNEGKLIVTINENDETQLSWNTFDMESEKYTVHQVPLPDRKKFTDGGGFPVSILENGRIYFSYQLKNDDYRVLVFNPTSANIEYEGNITNKNPKIKLSLSDMRLK
ncbi:hypothetical protein [Exiguobacterium acetylicum]|uniref:hypothetical protein n=1 Tax=Exiguobacterium acetylicum TaxID=41170 RepID=UPI000680B315|nr:hypothetical protein [Exiguobacterium acetylicum]KNH37490.1 hypothetical protein ACS74_00970 [Exiguobacterium acetylicum]